MEKLDSAAQLDDKCSQPLGRYASGPSVHVSGPFWVTRSAPCNGSRPPPGTMTGSLG